MMDALAGARADRDGGGPWSRAFFFTNPACPARRAGTLLPLLSAEPVEPAYLTLDEALERQLARISEVSEFGSVPELRFAITMRALPAVS